MSCFAATASLLAAGRTVMAHGGGGGGGRMVTAALSSSYSSSSSSSSSLGLAAVAAAAATASSSSGGGGMTSTADCDSHDTKPQTRTELELRKLWGIGKQPRPRLRKRMTSIGRFAVQTEMPSNPSIPTFFLAFSGPPLTPDDFQRAWSQRGMAQRHDRFHSTLVRTSTPSSSLSSSLSSSSSSSLLFEEDSADWTRLVRHVVPHYQSRAELTRAIQSSLTTPLDLSRGLWQVQISHGPLGSSGAISPSKALRIADASGSAMEESVLLFRAHHGMADGVSLTAAMADLCDDAAESLQGDLEAALRRRRRKKPKWWLRRWLQRLAWTIWFCTSSLQAIVRQVYLSLTMPVNPFWHYCPKLAKSDASASPPQRSLSWCDAALLQEVKEVAKAFGSGVTLNDVFCSCVSAALVRQLREWGHIHQNSSCPQKLPSRLALAIPVHLGGGVLLPGQSMGNQIGAVMVRVPGQIKGEENGTAADAAVQRLEEVHASLSFAKRTPAALLSHFFAKACSQLLPTFVNRWMFYRQGLQLCAVVTNARGSPQPLYFQKRRLESSAAFFPLPPGVAVGVVVASYAGTVSLSVTAEPWAIPDANQFLQWVLEEYQVLRQEAQRRQGQGQGQEEEEWKTTAMTAA